MAGSPSNFRQNEPEQLTLIDAENEHDLFGFDSAIRSECGVVCGIDEAGRGPLAGDVFAAAVIFDEGVFIEGINDSKKLTEKRREELYDKIMQTAVYAKVILASPEEIDRVNILNATKNAMAMAAKDAPCDLFLVDAITRLDVPGEVRGLVHGDALCYSIAAASILAKVTRDRIMRELDARYPQYGLAKNKGYGTAEHIAALRQYGPTPIHRRSFIGHFVEV